MSLGKFREYKPFSLSIKGLCSRSVTLFQQLSSSVRNSDFFCPLWSASVFGASGKIKDVTNLIALSTAFVAWCQNALISAVAYRICMILFLSAAKHVDF